MKSHNMIWYLTGEDILPSNNQQIIEQARFTYSPLGKAFDKKIKTIEDQGKKQVDAINTLKSNNNNNNNNNNNDNNNNKNIITNIFRLQAYDSIMCRYFCNGFIDFMLAGKKLTDYTN